MHDGDSVGDWSILNPGVADQFPQADNNALALREQFYNRSILLLPALGRDGQDALMRRHPELRADFVIAGLPSRDEPLCEPLLDMLRARIVITNSRQRIPGQSQSSRQTPRPAGPPSGTNYLLSQRRGHHT